MTIALKERKPDRQTDDDYMWLIHHYFFFLFPSLFLSLSIYLSLCFIFETDSRFRAVERVWWSTTADDILRKSAVRFPGNRARNSVSRAGSRLLVCLFLTLHIFWPTHPLLHMYIYIYIYIYTVYICRIQGRISIFNNHFPLISVLFRFVFCLSAKKEEVKKKGGV